MSITFIGVIVTILSFVGQVLDIPVVPEDIETTIMTIGLFVGALVAFFGRWRKGDLTVFGFRKKE